MKKMVRSPPDLFYPDPFIPPLDPSAAGPPLPPPPDPSALASRAFSSSSSSSQFLRCPSPPPFSDAGGRSDEISAPYLDLVRRPPPPHLDRSATWLSGSLPFLLPRSSADSFPPSARSPTSTFPELVVPYEIGHLPRASTETSREGPASPTKMGFWPSRTSGAPIGTQE